MKFLRLRKANEQIHKVPFEASNAAECAKQLIEDFDLYNHFSSEVSLGDMIETRDGNKFVVQDVMDFAESYEKSMKKESAIQQPNKPKPTTTLPDNMEWSWDPNAADWVAVMKNNTNVTPPLYNPQNQNLVNQNTTNYMSTIKSASSLSILPRLLDKVWYDYEEETAGKYAKIGSWEIGLGGYDTGYEVSYNGTPIFSITEDNELKPYMSDDRLQKDFGFSYSDVEKALKKHRDMDTLKRVGSTKNHSFYVKEDFPSFNGDTRVAVIEEDENGEIFDWNYFDTMEEAEAFERKMNKKVKSSNIEYKTEEIMNYFRNKNKKVFDWFDEDNGSVIKNGNDIYIEKHSFVNVPNYIYNAVQKWAFSNGYSFYSKTASKKIISKIVHTETYKDSKITVWEYDDRYSKNYGTYSYYVESDGYNSPEGSGTTNSKEDAIKEAKNYIDSYLGNKKQSSCLAKFLDGPQYSKEIKIEAGLIKEGLVKYAGFDFNRGTKYAITTKGLEVLRRASEAEHNEALNEREKLAYMFGFNTDEVSTLDTTGKVIKSEEVTDEQLEESWNKYFPLYRQDIEAEKITEENYPIDDEVAQHLKLMLKGHLQSVKRYRKAIPIMKYHTNKKMKRAVENGHSKGLSEDEITKQVDDIAEEYYKKENKIKPTFNSLSEDYLKSFVFDVIKNKKSGSLNKFARKWTICEADGAELGEVEADSELDAKVKFGIEHPEYADSQSICAKEINAQYEQTTNTKEPYPNPSETPNDHIILENHDGWVNTAAQVTPEFAKLHKLLGEYKKQDLIQLSDLDGNLVASGDPQIINELEHQVKEIGYYCESVDEYTDSDYAETYSLKIFMK